MTIRDKSNSGRNHIRSSFKRRMNEDAGNRYKNGTIK